MKEAEEHKWMNWLEARDEAGSRDSAAVYSDDEKAMSQLLDNLSHAEIPPMDTVSVRQNILAEIKSNGEKSSKLVPLRRWILASAAVLVLALLYTALLPSDTSISTLSGVINKHTLPDGSLVTLNGNSSMDYKVDFRENRLLQLDGEAFFEVKKGSRFTVETENGSIEVLGTSFNVHSYDKSLTVACKTGKVRVYNQKKESIDLLPGDLVRLGTEVIKRKVDINSMATWKSGQPHFTRVPLKEVIASLKNTYSISINLPLEHQEKSFTGTYVVDDINKALKMIFLPMEIHYTLENNVVSF